MPPPPPFPRKMDTLRLILRHSGSVLIAILDYDGILNIFKWKKFAWVYLHTAVAVMYLLL